MRIQSKLALILLVFVVKSAGAAPVQLPPATASSGGADARPKVTHEKRFASWTLSCAVAQDDRGMPLERCMVSQLVAIDPKGEKVVLGLTVDYADSPTIPTMRIRFSPRANMKAGIGIKIDNKPEMRLVINNCNTQRCESVGRLTTKVLELWRSGKQAQLAFIVQGGKQMLLPVSLAGFDAALSALDRYKPDKK